MGQALLSNNGSSTLASSITNSDVSLSVQAGEGVNFPTISGGSGDYFYCTLVDASNNIEIVKVTAVSTDTFTIVRAQDDTTAKAYTSGDVVSLRPVAAVFDEMMRTTGGTFTGAITAPGVTSTGALQVDGNTTLGDADTDTITMNADQIYTPNGMDVETGAWNFVVKPTHGGADLQTDAEVTATVDAAVAAVAEVPAGVMFDWPVATVPSGYLECDGSLVSKTTYPGLFAVLDYNYGGSGDDFGLPDAGGRVIVGRDGTYAVGATGGSTSSNHNIDLKEHSHMGVVLGNASQPSTNTTLLSVTNKFVYHVGNVDSRDNEEYRLAGTSSATPTAGQTTTEGDDAAPTITVSHMQPYLAMVKIIKT